MQAEMAHIPVGRLMPNPRNPRTRFDPQEHADLVASVRENGVLQAILVRPLQDGYEIVAGERRWRAAKEAHGDEYPMPCQVRQLDDREADACALIENIDRVKMNPLDEARGAARLLGLYGGDREETARRLGWSRSKLETRLALTNASAKVQDALAAGRISLGHAELLAAAPPEKQDKALDGIIGQKLTVEQVRQSLTKIAYVLKDASFDRKECMSCPSNSDVQTALFAETIGAGHCTNPACYEAKTEAVIAEVKRDLETDYPKVMVLRRGENFIPLRLVADGPTGVGEEQAKACRGCATFGATVSIVPGNVGAVETDICFNADCNADKVAAALKAARQAERERAAAVTPKDATSSKETGGSTAAPVPKATSVHLTQRMKEYRSKIWRQAVVKELRRGDRARHVLIALGAIGRVSDVDSFKYEEACRKLLGESSSTDLTENLPRLEAAASDTVAILINGLAMTAMHKLEERHVCGILAHYAVDLGQHWRLNAEFLDIMSKSEIELVAEELGLREAAGKKWSAIMAKKKAELIEGLLNVEGFAYEGKVPKVLSFAQAAAQD